MFRALLPAFPDRLPAGTKGPRGRATTQPKVATKPERVDAVAARLPAKAWKRVVVAEGSQGPRLYEYAFVWVWFSEEGLPSGRERLLVRRSLSQQAEVKYHRAHAPPVTASCASAESNSSLRSCCAS